MKLTRRDRITLELLGPPLLGGAAAGVWAWSVLVCHSVPRPQSFWAAAAQLGSFPVVWVVYTVCAFPRVGLQAACYAAIMEWAFSAGLSPRSWRAFTLSILLGCLSGLPLALGYGFERKDTWYFFSIVGPTVGAVLGLLIRRGSRCSDSSPRPSSDFEASQRH